MERLLEVRNLKVTYHTRAGDVQAVRGADFHLDRGETLAVVGESGCGKTAVAKAVMRLIEKPRGEIEETSMIFFEGRNVLEMDKKEIRKLRGGEIGMIFQDPMTSLNPTMRIGDQIAESLMLHCGMKRKPAFSRACELLKQVRINDWELMAKRYPHEFSGGMRQRAMIAMAAAGGPRIIIADEPTTALDLTIQAEIMGLLRELKKNTGTSMMLITHDLAIAAGSADRVHIMYAGRIVEKAETKELFGNPAHPYTEALLNSAPGPGSESKSRLATMAGSPPDLIGTIRGCAFAKRCGSCMPICLEKNPGMVKLGAGHEAACWKLIGDTAGGEAP
ncbi:MAG: oppD [Firmicutes bacterium]|nr:oppD [Bacillota bacterium]